MELHLGDLIYLARKVSAEVERRPVSQLAPLGRFALALQRSGAAVDADLWRSSVGMMRTVIGPEGGDFLFAFPYPDLVTAAFGLFGTNKVDAFDDRRWEDYPEGRCVPDCPGRCDHFTQIGAAYERAGNGALWLGQVVYWTSRTVPARR